MGSTAARRLARVSWTAFIVGLVLTFASVFLPPVVSAGTCFGGSSARPGDPGVTCTTHTSGNALLSNLASAAIVVALVGCVAALLAAVIVAVRADARAHRAWHARPDGPAPSSAARSMLRTGGGLVVAGLVASLVATWLASGAASFPPLQLPQIENPVIPVPWDTRVVMGLAVGLGALAAQWLGILLLAGSAVDALVVARASRRAVVHVDDAG